MSLQRLYYCLYNRPCNCPYQRLYIGSTNDSALALQTALHRLYKRPYKRLYDGSTNDPMNGSIAAPPTALRRLYDGSTNSYTNSSMNNSTNGSTIAYTNSFIKRLYYRPYNRPYERLFNGLEGAVHRALFRNCYVRIPHIYNYCIHNHRIHNYSVYNHRIHNPYYYHYFMDFPLNRLFCDCYYCTKFISKYPFNSNSLHLTAYIYCQYR